jgi:hypothetical protein
MQGGIARDTATGAVREQSDTTGMGNGRTAYCAVAHPRRHRRSSGERSRSKPSWLDNSNRRSLPSARRVAFDVPSKFAKLASCQ